jgi:hypothetical protein
VQALRLLAGRRLGHDLTHVDALRRLEQHGGVDAAIDALVRETETARLERARHAGGPAALVTAAPLQPPAGRAVAGDAGVQAAEGSIASTAPSRRREGVRRTAAVAGTASALIVAAAGFGRVWSAIHEGHGARWTFAIACIALALAASMAVAALGPRREGSTPRLELIALALTVAAAAVVSYVEWCALPSPLGLERMLDGPALSVSVAAVAAAAATAALAAIGPVRAPVRGGSRTRGRSGRRR